MPENSVQLLQVKIFVLTLQIPQFQVGLFEQNISDMFYLSGGLL